MTKEFNLSSKRRILCRADGIKEGCYRGKDVKEFIKKRNRLDMMNRNREITWQEYIERRNKLAGEELSR